MGKVPRETNAGHCWDRVSRQGSACKGAQVMIVIDVDIAGNGGAGASSKCVKAGNEPHKFLRCQLFDGAAAEMETTGPWFARQPLPTAGKGMQILSSHAMRWTCPAACREGAL